MCLSCGQPFPFVPGERVSLTPSSRTRDGGVPWGLIAILVGLAVLGGVIVTGLVFARHHAQGGLSPGNGVFDPGEPTAADPTATAPPPSASSKPGPPPLSDAEKDELPGTYTCSMDDTPAFACRIAGGELEKLGGSQRFKGPVQRIDATSFSFHGTFFCPFGDCTHPVAATFARQAPGKWVGKFGPNSVPGGGPGGERVVLTKVGR